MSLALIIAGWAFAIIAASTLVWHSRREQAARIAWARASGLDLYQGRPRELFHRFRGLTLMQVGHSRRILAAFVLPNGGYAFCYLCQTGFDQERHLHTWLVAALEVPHDLGRAVVTAQDWLSAAAQATSCRVLPLDFAARSSHKVAIVEDSDAWHSRLGSDLGRWLRSQPAERNWEILPGWVVGYEAGAREGPPLLALVSATRELTSLLRGGAVEIRRAGAVELE